MADPPNNPHDAYFRHVLEQPANAAGELRAVLPPAVTARVDWDALELQSCSYVSPALRSRFSDLLFRTRLAGHDAYLFLLVEHQSRPDPLMPFRMLEYTVRIWNRYIAEHPKTTTLPAVVPLVVHASPKGECWTKPTELAELIDIDPDTRDALGDHLPSLRFLLDDLTTIDVAALRARDLTTQARVMLVLQKIAAGNKHLGEDLLALVEDLLTLAAAPGGTAELECVVTYILTVSEIGESDLDPLIDRLGPHAREVIMTTADRLRAEGEARGEAKGRSEALLEQLTLKFGEVPETVVSTVRATDSAQLKAWSARVLTAGSLDEVFR
ncbi:Rpn family recombination-promoting nuclease/putative transposase [Nocardia tengchongensis]|uniref:Rpn family recombination-promoting nuclease/putative transposase n=1 Tax=Nocardia tengchongensis TaxID=2055889 RepID=UPI003668659C